MQNQRRPLYFIHIPKAGGTTLISVLDRYYSHDEIFPAQLWRELVRIPQEGIKNYRVFRGHFGAEGLDPFLPPDTAKITFLRHPTALSYSRYRFIQREPGSRVHRHARNVSFKEFLDNPRTRSRIANKQVRALSFSISHVAGVGPIFPYPVPRKKVDDWLSRRRQRMNPKKAYVRAIASLEKCAFHGIVERYDESLALLSYTLDLPPVGAVQALRMVNRPSDIDALKISERRLVEEYNHWDLELYERAKKEFDSRFAAMLKELDYFESLSGCVDDDGEIGDWEAFTAVLERFYVARSALKENGRNEGQRLFFDFSDALWGTGWHRREIAPADRSFFRWTGPGTRSTLRAPFSAVIDYCFIMRILNTIDLKLFAGLEVVVNGRTVPLRTVDGEGTNFRTIEADIPREILNTQEKIVRLDITVPFTVSPASCWPGNPDYRSVGLAVNWVLLQPVAEDHSVSLPSPRQARQSFVDRLRVRLRPIVRFSSVRKRLDWILSRAGLRRDRPNRRGRYGVPHLDREIAEIYRICADWERKRISNRIIIAKRNLDEFVVPWEVLVSQSGDRKRFRSSPLIFNHIPKCGGQTLRHLIGKNMNINGLVQVNYNFIRRNPGSLLKRNQFPAVLMGHFRLTDLPYALVDKEFVHITMLRDPVRRTISHYNSRRGQVTFEKRFGNVTFDEYIRGTEVKEIHNGQTCRIAGITPRKLARNAFPHDEVLAMAKANLELRFSLFGITERFIEFLIMAHRLLGWGDLYYEKKNVSKHFIEYEDLGESTLNSIRENNALDVEFYEFGRTLFQQRCQEIGIGTRQTDEMKRLNNAYLKIIRHEL